MIARSKKDAEPFLRQYKKYFDEVIIEEALDCKDFSKARQKTLDKVKTKYWCWFDTDDNIDHPEVLRDLLRVMDENELDAIYLQYNYGYSPEGELSAVHWRERIMRTSHPFKWVGAVHETLDSQQQPKRVKNEEIIVKHQVKSLDEVMESAKRNHKIMVKAFKDGDDDPRLLYYLGRSYFMLKDYQKSATFLLKYTEVSGWNEQKYDAWLKIGDCMIQIDELERAINSTWEAIKILPHWPDGYTKLGDIYLELNQPEKAVQWFLTALKKRPPETMEIINPAMYTYHPLISLAGAYFQMAKVDAAYEVIKQAEKFKPKSKRFDEALKSITTAYIEEKTIKQAAWLGKFVGKNGNLKSYIEGLPPFIKNDLRMRDLRKEAYPGKKWDDKSIVFYCGEQWEKWGADTLDKGMGGSEEAIVYLSRQLAWLGYDVTIYNERTEEYIDKFFESPLGTGQEAHVTYKPWPTFNPEDEFNVFIAWRQPMFAPALKIKARVKGVDMHDSPGGHQAIPEKAIEGNDLFFFKSEFQRKQAPQVPDEKCVVIPNGIVQFNQKVKRNPHKVIYASSADRGLDVLLEMWPDIKKEVPDVELVWPYGWNSYDALHKGSTEHGKWKWNVVRKMADVGAKELGRLSHEDLAKEFLSSGVWAYPTSFWEIDCITAKKAQAGGVEPITSGYAALQESVLKHEEEIEDIHDKPKELEKFKKRVIHALKNPVSEDKRKEIADKIINKYGWDKIAQQWKEVL